MLQEVTCCNICNSLFPKLCIAIFLPEHSHILTMSTRYKYNIRLDNIIIVFWLYFYTAVAIILMDVGQKGSISYGFYDQLFVYKTCHHRVSNQSMLNQEQHLAT